MTENNEVDINTLLASYSEAASSASVEKMMELSDQLLSLTEQLIPFASRIAETLTASFNASSQHEVRLNVVFLLHQLKEIFLEDSAEAQVIHDAFQRTLTELAENEESQCEEIHEHNAGSVDEEIVTDFEHVSEESYPVETEDTEFEAESVPPISFTDPASVIDEHQAVKAEVQRVIDSTKNSSKRHLSALLTLLESEKDNIHTFPLVSESISHWIANAVKVENDFVFVKDIEGITLLAKNHYPAATYYLAIHLAQDQKIQEALTVSARFILSKTAFEQDELTIQLKQQALHFIEDHAKQSLKTGLWAIFSRQDKLIHYAKDLLEIIKLEAPSDQPDKIIEEFLYRKPMTPNRSYNKYVMDVRKLGLK